MFRADYQPFNTNRWHPIRHPQKTEGSFDETFHIPKPPARWAQGTLLRIRRVETAPLVRWLFLQPWQLQDRWCPFTTSRSLEGKTVVSIDSSGDMALAFVYVRCFVGCSEVFRLFHRCKPAGGAERTACSSKI